MANKHCGGKRSPGPKTVPVQPHQRSKPGKHCFGKATPEISAMSYRSSLAQIRAKARAEAARIQTSARQAAFDNQRHLEQRIRALTCNGTKPLTKAQIEQLSRESARYFRMRLNK